MTHCDWATHKELITPRRDAFCSDAAIFVHPPSMFIETILIRVKMNFISPLCICLSPDWKFFVNWNFRKYSLSSAECDHVKNNIRRIKTGRDGVRVSCTNICSGAKWTVSVTVSSHFSKWEPLISPPERTGCTMERVGGVNKTGPRDGGP